MKKNIFVALDFSNFDKALDVASSVKNDAVGLKITNELFAICGKEGLKELSDFGLEIFLDLKILDIPNTVKKTVASITSLKTVKYLTVHTSGDYDMLKAAQESSGQLELLGVTVLTSQSSSKILSFSSLGPQRTTLSRPVFLTHDLGGILTLK